MVVFLFYFAFLLFIFSLFTPIFSFFCQTTRDFMYLFENVVNETTGRATLTKHFWAIENSTRNAWNGYLSMRISLISSELVVYSVYLVLLLCSIVWWISSRQRKPKQTTYRSTQPAQSALSYALYSRVKWILFFFIWSEYIWWQSSKGVVSCL